MTTAIDIFGVTFSEPVTSLTDWLVTAVAWWLGIRLCRVLGDRRQLTFPWGIGFWLIGFAALVGGISHAFATYLSEAAYFWIWKATIYSIALSVTFALAGTISATVNADRISRVLHAVNIVVFTAYAIWMLNHSSFRYVILHYVPVMLTIALLHAWAWSRHRDEAGKWIIAGVVVTLAGAAIQRSGFSIHRWFNHNDLYHIVQVLGLYLLYSGLAGKRLSDAPERV